MKKIVVAVLIGLLVGYAATTYHIVGPCTGVPPPGEDNAHCVSITREYASLNDLIHNTQNRSVEFIEGFALGSLISFALLSVFAQTKKLRPKKPVM